MISCQPPRPVGVGAQDARIARSRGRGEARAGAQCGALGHPEQAIAWGDNGRAHARIAFGWSRCASEYEAVYSEAMR